jgi:hypothetical protein
MKYLKLFESFNSKFEQSINLFQDKTSTIYSNVYEIGIDESKKVLMKATLTNDDNELIEDLILEFVEKWQIENSKFAANGWNLKRHDRFQIWLQFALEKSKKNPELLSDMKSMIGRIRKFGYNVSEFTHKNRGQTIFTFTISHKVEESKLTSSTKDDIRRYLSILDDVCDLFVTEMYNWNFIEYDMSNKNDSLNLQSEMRKHPEKDFVFRIRLASFMGESKIDHSICIDVVYNTDLLVNSNSKTTIKLIHDLFKFSRKCVQKLGLSVRPFSIDMSRYDNFSNKIIHFHGLGELRFYLGFDDEDIRVTNESNMPHKFEDDEDEPAIVKWVRFKEQHPQIDFTQFQKDQIQNLLDKFKFSYGWNIGLNEKESLYIFYNKLVDHNKSKYNKIVINISAHEDEWFLISEVSTSRNMYLADQFDQVIEFIKNLENDN